MNRNKLSECDSKEIWEDIVLGNQSFYNACDTLDNTVKVTRKKLSSSFVDDDGKSNGFHHNHELMQSVDLENESNEDEPEDDEFVTPPGSPEVDHRLHVNGDSLIDSDIFYRRSSTITGSLVDQLLAEIRFKLSHFDRRCSRCSDISSFSSPESTYRKPNIRRANLLVKDPNELNLLIDTLNQDVKQMNNVLLHHLKRKDRLFCQRDQLCDIITAYIQAISPKRRVDTKMRFSIEPIPNKCSGFNQWHDAMRMVARLPGGIPNEFRKKLWLTLSERHVESRKIVWSSTAKFCFNDKCNPEDDSLGTQIVKDLHRTGCSLFSGTDSEHNQALLKQVLLAYARWNRSVGYCQGFNMLAAIILEVMDWDVQNSLKVMIYLIEGVLPTSYFANNLRGLSVDMAAFRDLLRLRLPDLARHLERLQNDAQDYTTGASYEPPLINVFTMQWFLTLFSNCLPKPIVLRIWDLIFLEGNEILIRTALAIWDCLQDRVITVESADEFYSIMGVLTREMMEFGIRDANELIKTICTMAPFPFPQLSEFREKYTFNIRPLTSLVKKGVNLFCPDEEDDDSTSDPVVVASWCFFLSSSNMDPQRMSLDISLLKKQYMKLKERQRQAHIILIEGFQNAQANATNALERKQSLTVSHLLQGKTALIARRSWKPCPVQQPTVGHKSSPKGSSGKKFLTERSRTLANLISQPTQVETQSNSTGSTTVASGETLRWKDLRREYRNSSLSRKLSEPSLGSCRDVISEQESDEFDPSDVAFVSTPTSSESLVASGHSDGVHHRKHSDSDSDDDGLEFHLNRDGDNSNSSSGSESGSTELCDSDFSDVDLDSQTVMRSLSNENFPSKKQNSTVNVICNNPVEYHNDHNAVKLMSNQKLDANQNEQINYDEIKREISDLSVEQCIRKLNEKMSSLNTFE
ncbi:TBC1 domain family member 30-like isoform X2 [Brevipalpus obovatus]|uniref:TBC1 domain family member 30-like isoform X2 n=1 Tax=Brevipalpus obovatus TaxID=246614 RepID=UPI003D9EAA8A